MNFDVRYNIGDCVIYTNKWKVIEKIGIITAQCPKIKRLDKNSFTVAKFYKIEINGVNKLVAEDELKIKE